MKFSIEVDLKNVVVGEHRLVAQIVNQIEKALVDLGVEASVVHSGSATISPTPFVSLLEPVLPAIEGAMGRLDHHIQTAILAGDDERADNQVLVELANAKAIVASALARQDLGSRN